MLLVEDQERLRTIVAMMLEELGANVTGASDGEQALTEYENARPRFDLVLLDVKLTGLSGGATFKRLTELDPGVKVVLSSGVLPDEDILELLAARRGGFIEKPFNLDRLADVLGRVLSGEPSPPGT